MARIETSDATIKTPTARILWDLFFRRRIRKLLSDTRTTASKILGLGRMARYPFIFLVFKDFTNFLFNHITPIPGETPERAKAAVDWILHAQAMTKDDGVSYGYFPYGRGDGWQPSYPETTGYIISSLLEYGTKHNRPDIRKAALDMALWEVNIQMESGAVQAGMLCSGKGQVAAAFNTGMVLEGWSAAYRLTQDDRFLKAGRRAADFLVGDVGEDGYFQAQGDFMASLPIKTYTGLCAWPLCSFSKDSGDERYQSTAIRVIEATLKQQQSNGWFGNNCLTRPEAPLLHTIGYTLQGILEVGINVGREDFIDAAKRGVDPLITRMTPNGFLPGRFYSDWSPAAFSSCLTGSAQVAVICYRLYEYTGEEKYLKTANSLLNFLKALQVLDTSISGIRGAIPGSFPLVGGYMMLGYPNWATKYFLDALMWQHRFESQ